MWAALGLAWTATLGTASIAAALPDDPGLRKQWGLRNTGQKVAGRVGLRDADVDAAEAWRLQRNAANVVVAVIDTGVALDHPELADNLWLNKGETGLDGAGRDRRTNRVDDDRNGYRDDWRGWDYAGPRVPVDPEREVFEAWSVLGDNDPSELLAPGHGTHVAATLAARTDNDRGIAGVAWRARLMPLRVGFDRVDSAGAAAGVRYAGRMGARVAAIGIAARPVGTKVLDDALKTAHRTLFVVPAGNHSRNLDRAGLAPCTSRAPNVVCVAASDQRDRLAPYSNYGRRSVDLAAPGRSILSAAPVYRQVFSEDFETPLGDDWKTGGFQSGWERRSIDGGHHLAHPTPDLGTYSYAQTRALNTSGLHNCLLRFRLHADVPRGTLRVEASPRPMQYWRRVALLGAGGLLEHAGRMRFEVPSDVTGGGSIRLRFAWSTDVPWTEHQEPDGGISIDDVDLRCPEESYPRGRDRDAFLYRDGTSFAVAYVAGAAALYKARYPGAGVADMKHALLAGVDRRRSLRSKARTGGRLNIARSLRIPPRSR
jgi:subtilisin family serine protease